MFACFARRLTSVVLPWLVVVALSVGGCDPSQRSAPTQPDSVAGAPAPETSSSKLPLPEGGIGLGLPSLLPLLSGPGGIPGAPLADTPILPPPAPGTVRVAILLPLTGANGDLGQAMLNAAQMALFDVAADDFELLPYDTAGDPEQAYFAASLAIAEGARLILGPLLAASAQAVAPAVQAANVPVVSFSSDRSVAGNGIYIFGFTPESEVERVVSYARRRGLYRFAVMSPDNPYGRRVAAALFDAVDRSGGLVTRADLYPPETINFDAAVQRLLTSRALPPLASDETFDTVGSGSITRTALAELRPPSTATDSAGRPATSLPFDSVLVADGGQRLQAIGAHLPVHGIDAGSAQILGTGAWDEPTTGAEPALVGGWFAAPPAAFRADFEEAYETLFKQAPPRLATLAYDATALAAVLAAGSGTAGFTPEQLTNVRGFQGRDGIFRFDPAGYVERGLAILEVQRRSAEVIDEAPVSFTYP